MDWMQCLTIIASFSGLVFFLNKNHREDMNRMDDKFAKAMQENDKHWRDMFMYMNGRLDSSENNKSKG